MRPKNLKRVRSVIVLSAVAAAACGGETGPSSIGEPLTMGDGTGGFVGADPAGRGSGGESFPGTGGYVIQVGTGGVVGLPEPGGAAGAAGSGPFEDDF